MDLQPFFAVRHLYHWVSTPFMSIITKIKRGSFQPTKALFFDFVFGIRTDVSVRKPLHSKYQKLWKREEGFKDLYLFFKKIWSSSVLGLRGKPEERWSSNNAQRFFFRPYSWTDKETKVCKRCFLSFCRPKDVEGSSNCSTPRARLREPFCFVAFVQPMNKKRTEQWGWPAFSSCIQKFALA